MSAPLEDLPGIEEARARRLHARGLVPLLFGLSNEPVFARFVTRHYTRATGGLTLRLSPAEPLPRARQVWVPRWVGVVLLLSPSFLCANGELTPAGRRVADLLAKLEADEKLRDALLSALAMGGTEGAAALLLEAQG